MTRTSTSPIRTCALVLATACAAALASGTATAGSIVYAKDNAVWVTSPTGRHPLKLTSGRAFPSPSLSLAVGRAAAGATPRAASSYGARASAICAEGRHRLASAGAGGGPSSAFVRGLPIMEQTVSRLHRLPAPPRLVPAVTRWLRGYDGLLTAVRGAVGASHAGGGSLSARRLWTALAPYASRIEDGAFAVGAYRCAGENTVAPPTPAQPAFAVQAREVVVDTDMGADDWMAILYLLRRPDVHLRAITVSGAGLAHCRPGVRNALRLLRLARADDVPVACGREHPLRGSRSFPASWRRRADGMLGLGLPEGSRSGRSRLPAADLLAAAIGSSPTPVSLLTLGPLTNVADAFGRHPGLSRQLRGITIMGGAITAAGNAPGRAAEWNFFVDPSAAAAVLRSGATVTLVPLDATNRAPLDRSFYEGVRSARRTPSMRFVLAELTRQRGAIDKGASFFWDPLAAAALTDGIVRVERRALHVVESGRLAGWTWSGGGGASVGVAARPERNRFERIFLGVLAGGQASGSSPGKAP